MVVSFAGNGRLRTVPGINGEIGGKHEQPHDRVAQRVVRAAEEIGTPDPADTFTVSADTPDEGPEVSPSEDDGGCGDHAPEKDDCDCADDEDGTSQCSFRLRISLGSPTPGENAGFLWTSLEEPTAISPAVFNVLGTAAVSSTTNALGEFTVTCSVPHRT